MSFGNNIPQKQMYEEMQDTPYISNLRDLSQKGYEGYANNYNKVNVFDQDTQRSLNDINNNYYKRAESDFDKQYRDTMNKYQNRNYGQFGTLNATPALYRTDTANLQQQRKLADLEYNKAMNYDTLKNNELQRRYNTLNMYNTMLEKGQTPYQQDLLNWQTRNTNKDRQFENDVAGYNASGSFGRWLGSFYDPLNILGLSEAFGPTYQGMSTGNTATVNGSNLLNAIMAALGVTGGITGGSSLANTIGGLFGSGSGTSALGSNINNYVNGTTGYGSTISDAINDYIGGSGGSNLSTNWII